MTDESNEPDAAEEPESVEEPEAEETDPNALPEVTLDSLPSSLREAMKRAAWEDLTPVQARAIPYMLKGRDLMVQSRTGSGKTGAFVLPMLKRLDLRKASCQALVLTPTRELAKQVARDAETLSGDSGMRTVAVYGGVGYEPQLKAFKKGAHLVVGTPGRVLDHLLKGNLRLDDIELLIFDEADRMLSMGFYPDMKAVQRYLPRRHVNGCMFSATFPAHVMGLAGQFLDEPDFLTLSSGQVHVTDTDHVFYTVPAMDKDRCLVRIIEMENPTSAIIFCNTKAKCHYVSVVLQRFGYDADELSSDLSQAAREATLARVRKGNLRFLVATDVAARGIDIPELSHVFLYEPPEDHEDYIHRAGRTGRAGASGVAISLVADMEAISLQRIAKRYKIEMEERETPTREDVSEFVSERVTALLEARLRTKDKLEAERMLRFLPLARSLGDSDDELAIIAMLLDDFYHETLHAAPETPEAPRVRESKPRGGRSSSEGDKRKRPRRRSGRNR